MSYGIDLLFKQIPRSEVFDHIKKVKERFLDSGIQCKLLKDNFYYSPYRILSPYRENKEIDQLAEDWIQRVFTYKFIYLDEYQVLAMVSSNQEFLEDLFDSYIFAQNSCDQDYDWGIWERVPSFKAISDPIKNMNPQEFLNYYNSNKACNQSELDEEDLDDTPKQYASSNSKFDYRKRSYVYDLIYDSIENRIWGNSKESLYVSFIYGQLEFINLRNLLKKIYVDYLVEEIKKNEIDLKVIEDMYPNVIYKLVKRTIEKETDGNP